MKIRKKIGFSFAFFIIASSLVWLLSYYNYYQLTSKLRLIEEKVDLLNMVLEFRRYEKNFFLYFNRSELEQAISYVTNAEKKQHMIINHYGRYISNKTPKIDLNNFKEYRTLLINLLTLYDNNPEKVNQNDPSMDHIRKIGKRITDQIEEVVRHEKKMIRVLINNNKIYHYLALGVLVILIIITTLFLALNVNRPLKRIEKAIQKIEKVDYTNIPERFEGDIFESLVNSLNSMINVLNRRNDQLVHSQKLASLGTLTSGVAHELNNPLNNISTSIQIILEELEEPNIEFKRRLLQETENQADRARGIIKALLEFSRERAFVPKEVNFKDLVENTLKLIKGEISASITVHLDIEEDLIVVIGINSIQRVLMNLIINAIHAMDHGGELHIMAKKMNDKQFLFKVGDTGHGMPQEAISKIFDPFYTTKEVGKGTGLGLSVSHGIIKQHGGKVEVESEINKGTVFTVYLPIVVNC